MCFLSHSRILERLRSKPGKHDEESGLRNRHATPVESIPLPAATVPHRDGDLHSHVEEDAKALRDMFSTSSPVRGYEAARIIPGCDPSTTLFTSDADVARQTPSRSANGKLGALGHAVKQRLSESRLSKESFKTVCQRKHSLDSPGARGIVSTSGTSTGLTDLLMSRNASEGGYDSDARDISTLRLRKSVDQELLSMNSECISKALHVRADLPTDADPPAEETASTLAPKQRPGLPATPTGNHDVVEGEECHGTVSAATAAQEVSVPKTKGDGNGTFQQDGGPNVGSRTSQSLSEDRCLHLGDMRISQRLASTSVMPVSSPSSTDYGSDTGYDDGVVLSTLQTPFSRFDPQQVSANDDLPWHLQRQHGVAARYPGFVVQEHNRKPSDPRTRKLFEDTGDISKPQSKPKPTAYAKSIQTDVNGGYRMGADASSHDTGKCGLLESGTAHQLSTAHSETIKNTHSLAVAGRGASAGLGLGCGSLGHLPNAQEDAWFGDSKDKHQHSLQEFQHHRTLHKTATQVAPLISECEMTSRESRFTEEAMHQNSRELRLLSSVEVNEAMSEITDNTLQERRQERMSEVAQHVQVLQARSRDSIRRTRSSEGWPGGSGQHGSGYHFIKRTPSHNWQLPYEMDRHRALTNETATVVWDGALKKMRGVGPVQNSSNSMLCVPFWSNLGKRQSSSSSFNEQQAHDCTQSRSFASEKRATPRELPGGHLDPRENKQRMIPQTGRSPSRLPAQCSLKTWKDVSRPATSLKKSPQKKNPFKIRRYTIAGVNSESGISPTAFSHEFRAWRKFPPHAIEGNNASAGKIASVTVRDFGTLHQGVEEFDLFPHLTIEKNKSASRYGDSFPGSWRKRALTHMRRKSKSMTFAQDTASRKHKTANRSLLWQMKDFYRSQSSDLRRFQREHRSSVTLARESGYPELDIPAGFGSPMRFTISPTTFSMTSRDQSRMSGSTDEESLGPTDQRDAELRRSNTGPGVGWGTENCCPVGEAKRSLPPKRLQTTSVSKGLDGTVSSRISEDHHADLADSDSDLNSSQGRQENGTHGSFVSVTASNGFGNESGDFGVESREFRLASTELRDSTVDFRKALMEREQKSRDELLKLAQGLDGTGPGDCNKMSNKKEEHNKDKKAC